MSSPNLRVADEEAVRAAYVSGLPLVHVIAGEVFASTGETSVGDLQQTVVHVHRAMDRPDFATGTVNLDRLRVPPALAKAMRAAARNGSSVFEIFEAAADYARRFPGATFLACLRAAVTFWKATPAEAVAALRTAESLGVATCELNQVAEGFRVASIRVLRMEARGRG